MIYNFYNTLETKIIESSKIDLYSYRVFLGKNSIITSKFNSYWYLNDLQVVSKTGDGDVLESNTVCIEIIGYTPETRTSTFSKYSDLPYINGCSSKQLITPARVGDPTWQLLYIPPYTSEQEHHIHSTTRVVYVLSGKGTSHIGSKGHTREFDLEPGTVLILDKMIPHHFSTSDSELVVLPLHIFSSTESEKNHPMFNGTYRI